MNSSRDRSVWISTTGVLVVRLFKHITNSQCKFNFIKN
uniref:Uncharacterized protein n=1 Tax=Heterorhabditis bacteriophora TaxID=37862 RepID=A0A1I7WCH5_HETBA